MNKGRVLGVKVKETCGVDGTWRSLVTTQLCFPVCPFSRSICKRCHCVGGTQWLTGSLSCSHSLQNTMGHHRSVNTSLRQTSLWAGLARHKLPHQAATACPFRQVPLGFASLRVPLAAHQFPFKCPLPLSLSDHTTVSLMHFPLTGVEVDRPNFLFCLLFGNILTQYS